MGIALKRKLEMQLPLDGQEIVILSSLERE